MSVRCVSIEVISLREDAKEKRTARDFRVDVRAAHCCVAINAMGCSLIERRALSTAVCRGCFFSIFFSGCKQPNLSTSEDVMRLFGLQRYDTFV